MTRIQSKGPPRACAKPPRRHFDSCVRIRTVTHDHSKPQAGRTIEVGGESRAYLEQTSWVGLTGVAFLPATVAPLGLSPNGLPVGVQIAGPFLEDKTTIQLARLLTERIGGFEAPPDFEVS